MTGHVTLQLMFNKKNVQPLSPSDDQVRFPTSEGWFMINQVVFKGSWQYIRVTKEGTLEIQHFDGAGKKTFN